MIKLLWNLILEVVLERFFPLDASTTGHLIDHLFWLAFALICVAFALVLIILFSFLIQYRSRPGHTPFYTHGNSRQALMLTLFLALVVFFAIDVNLAYHDHEAWKKIWGQAIDKAQALRVEIMPEQFAWNIRYAGSDGLFNTADDVVTMNVLHVPVDKPVIVQLKSKDVIHSFFLPNFRIKMDAVPGMITSLTFQAVKKGEYDIACAEHCGLGHYRMRGSLTVEMPDDFNSWLAQEAKDPAEDTHWGWEWK